MNYNSWTFWLLYAAIFFTYWRLGHRSQNRLLLIASYVFYSYWDYRFLFLILVSTVIDFIGGLGVAGRRLPAKKLFRLGLLLVGSSVLLCAHIDYPGLVQALFQLNWRALDALPRTWDAYSIPLAVAGVTAVYGCALPWLYRLPEGTRRKTFLTISMIANVGILAFFKYFDFFISSFQAAAANLGWWASPVTLRIILPAGISFYTCQAMSYTIDIYRGEIDPTDDFADFALFVCFFPHLVAGPIMRAHTLLPQVTQSRVMKPGAALEGLYLVVIGLFKKMVVADNLAPVANMVFGRFASGHAGTASSAEVLVGLYAFAFQIYGDFSGYSSIARGISKWLGFDLVVNFDNPYLAFSPGDFWRRWHISLSTWLRDYLYIPLGGSRGGRLLTYRNLMITMLLGGLWHGANWTFVAWGLFHGLLLCFYRAMSRRGASLQNWLLRTAAVILMFHLTCIGWLLFRADTLDAAGRMLACLFVNWRMAAPGAAAILTLVAFYAGPLFLWESWLGGEAVLGLWLRRSFFGQVVVLTYLVVMLLLFRTENPCEFIYFQF